MNGRPVSRLPNLVIHRVVFLRHSAVIQAILMSTSWYLRYRLLECQGGGINRFSQQLLYTKRWSKSNHSPDMHQIHNQTAGGNPGSGYTDHEDDMNLGSDMYGV